MHEAGLVAQAISGVLDSRDLISGLELEITDPVGLSVDAVLLHLEMALAEGGLANVPVELSVSPVTCAACGASVVPANAEVFCPACGWPLPRGSGPPLRIRARRPAAAARSAGSGGARRLAVLGLGNRLQGDEALGSLVVDQLAASLPAELAEAVEAIDGGTVGLGLLPYLDDLDGLIIVDAIDHGASPGTIVEIEGLPLHRGAEPLSVHELGAAELLGALLVQDRLPPRLLIIGIQPQEIGLGTDLSPAVAARVPELLERVRDRLDAWMCEPVEMLPNNVRRPSGRGSAGRTSRPRAARHLASLTMCIAMPAQVLEVDQTGAIVESDGRRRRAATLLVPDVQVGDWVMVALGTIVQQLAPDEAREIRDAIREAVRLAEPNGQEGERHAAS